MVPSYILHDVEVNDHYVNPKYSFPENLGSIGEDDVEGEGGVRLLALIFHRRSQWIVSKI